MERESPARPPPSFSEAIDDIGMGPFQSRLLVVGGMAWMVDAIEVLVIAFVLEDVAVTFDLGSFEKGLVGSASFFGMIFGAVFWSVYADKRGRRSAFVASLACIFLAGLASAFAPSALWLVVFRILVGFGVGGSLPVTTILVSEFLPTNDRGQVLCRMSGQFWGAGLVSASVLGLVLNRAIGSSPGREEDMWRWFLGLASVPGVMVLAAYFFLPESPRFLSVVGRHDEAVQVVESVARANGKTAILGMSLSQPKKSDGGGVGLTIKAPSEDSVGSEKTTDGWDVRELFKTPTLRRATISCWMVWLFGNISYYGLTFLLPTYYRDIFGATDDFVYIFSSVLGVVISLSSYLSLWLSAEGRLGRVGTIKWPSFVTAVLMLVMALSYGTPAVFLPVSILTYFVKAVPSIVKFVITPELFSTQHRAVAMGTATIWSRIGAMLAPVVASVLYDKGRVLPLAVFGPSTLLVTVFCYMIPFETAGRKLDDEEDKTEHAAAAVEQAP